MTDIKLKVDSHVHSILTNHAYSTIEENAIHAKEKQLEAITITDHFGLFERNQIDNITASIANRKVLPPAMHDVFIIKGVEVDIIDTDGNLPFKEIPFYYNKEKNVLEVALECSQIVIASVHEAEKFRNNSAGKNTDMYIKVLQNPSVHIIGHCDRYGLEFDMREIARAAKRYKKAIEINGESLNTDPLYDKCKYIAEICAEEGTAITVGSDAHCAYSVGEFSKAAELLSYIHYPKELIISSSYKRYSAFFTLNK